MHYILRTALLHFFSLKYAGAGIRLIVYFILLFVPSCTGPNKELRQVKWCLWCKYAINAILVCRHKSTFTALYDKMKEERMLVKELLQNPVILNTGMPLPFLFFLEGTELLKWDCSKR